MTKILTKENLKCFMNQIGGEIDRIEDRLGLLPDTINAVLLGGGKLIHDGSEQKRETNDIDFYSSYSAEMAFSSNRMNLSPVATGASYPLTGGFNAEFFNRIEPDLSSDRTQVPSFADELEKRYHNNELEPVTFYDRLHVYNLPDDLFIVNKVAAYSPEREKDRRDIGLVMEKRYIDSEFKDSLKKSLEKFKVSKKYENMVGSKYPL